MHPQVNQQPGCRPSLLQSTNELRGLHGQFRPRLCQSARIKHSLDSAPLCLAHSPITRLLDRTDKLTSIKLLGQNEDENTSCPTGAAIRTILLQYSVKALLTVPEQNRQAPTPHFGRLGGLDQNAQPVHPIPGMPVSYYYSVLRTPLLCNHLQRYIQERMRGSVLRTPVNHLGLR